MNARFAGIICLRTTAVFGVMILALISNASGDEPAKKPDKPPVVAKTPEELGKNLLESWRNKDHTYQLTCTYDMVKERLEKEKASEETKKREQARMNLWNIGFALWNYEQKKEAEKQGYDLGKAELIEVKSAKVATKDGRKASESIEIRVRLKDHNDRELTLTPGAAEEIDGGWYFTPTAKDSDSKKEKK